MIYKPGITKARKPVKRGLWPERTEKNRCLLPDHLDEDPVGQFPSEPVNHPALDVAFQDLALGPWLGIRLAPLRSARIASPAGLIPRSLVSLFPALPHPPVHGIIGQAVGLGVAGAQGMGHVEALQASR